MFLNHISSMWVLMLAFALLKISTARDFESLSVLKSKTPDNIQAQTVAGMIQRFVGSRASDFNITVDHSLGPSNKDTFVIQTVGSQLHITASSGVAAAMGFYYYLKYFCQSQITWGGSNINLPNPLPVISPITITTPDRFRYYQNVCTVSYSHVFWNWDQWERHLDWMAIAGINLPLAFTGQEAIFQRLYMNLGITFEELEEFFGGPAFLAWARMGNIQGWGGPLPQTWITNQLLLQHRILQRMRDFGMTPVLPGFAGHVPAALTRIYPHANVSRLGGWGGFNMTYSHTYLLDFSDPLFTTLGAKFIQLMDSEFGVDHIYNADTFNEMDPKTNDTGYISSAGFAVFNAMQQGDPDAIWLMQGWLFENDGFWKPPQIKALLHSVPLGRMIILDLISELNPVYVWTESFYGQPFIWCMLHNFGGTMELYGALDNVNVGPPKGRAFLNSTMIGTGLTPEGIFQNEVVYEFMNEHAWRTAPHDIDVWLSEYTRQRYGFSSTNVDKAWHLLKSSVYNCSYNWHHDNDWVLITQRPGLGYSVTSDVWYDPEMLFSAWDFFLAASREAQPNELFLYDLVDVTRNSLQIISMSYYTEILKAFNASDLEGLWTAGGKIVDLLLDMETLLASDRHFLLGNWVEDAKAWGTDIKEKMLLEYNARNQITLWGPDGEIVDYASKQWSGVFKDFYVPRWELFVEFLGQLIITKKPWDGYLFLKQVLQIVEEPFTFALDLYPTTPTGDSVFIAQQLHDKYRQDSRGPFFHHLAKAAASSKKTNSKLTFSTIERYHSHSWASHESRYAA